MSAPDATGFRPVSGQKEKKKKQRAATRARHTDGSAVPTKHDPKKADAAADAQAAAAAIVERHTTITNTDNAVVAGPPALGSQPSFAGALANKPQNHTATLRVPGRIRRSVERLTDVQTLHFFRPLLYKAGKNGIPSGVSVHSQTGLAIRLNFNFTSMEAAFNSERGYVRHYWVHAKSWIMFPTAGMHPVLVLFEVCDGNRVIRVDQPIPELLERGSVVDSYGSFAEVDVSGADVDEKILVVAQGLPVDMDKLRSDHFGQLRQHKIVKATPATSLASRMSTRVSSFLTFGRSESEPAAEPEVVTYDEHQWREKNSYIDGVRKAVFEITPAELEALRDAQTGVTLMPLTYIENHDSERAFHNATIRIKTKVSNEFMFHRLRVIAARHSVYMCLTGYGQVRCTFKEKVSRELVADIQQILIGTKADDVAVSAESKRVTLDVKDVGVYPDVYTWTPGKQWARAKKTVFVSPAEAEQEAEKRRQQAEAESQGRFVQKESLIVRAVKFTASVRTCEVMTMVEQLHGAKVLSCDDKHTNATQRWLVSWEENAENAKWVAENFDGSPEEEEGKVWAFKMRDRVVQLQVHKPGRERV